MEKTCSNPIWWKVQATIRAIYNAIDTHLHLCGGTVGAILTCPLEVVKTRLQSSSITLYVSEVQLSTVNGASVARISPPGPLHCLRWVLDQIFVS
uniref:Uncharacterized protein n=1 Tax=Kryptolebias marmoratus TaxID=37003 RepID=A0A3Q2ZT37_KRYMA